MNIYELYKELDALAADIRRLQRLTDSLDADDLSAVDSDDMNPDDCMLKTEAVGIMADLEKVASTVEYIGQDIGEQGTLHKNERGRYEIGNTDRELTCGACVEILVPCEVYDPNLDEWVKGQKWKISRIEHDGKDYYCVGYKGEIEGLQARKRH